MPEQRRYQRVDFFCPLHLTVLQKGITVPASCFDISIGGVGLSTGIALRARANGPRAVSPTFRHG